MSPGEHLGLCSEGVVDKVDLWRILMLSRRDSSAVERKIADLQVAGSSPALSLLFFFLLLLIFLP